MILFYSGMTCGESLPERALAAVNPAIMLTYYEIHEKRGDTLKRFMSHANRRRAELKAKKKRKTK